MGKDFSPEYFYDSFRAARINENAWEEWREYREWLTEMIAEGIEPGASVAILGAGRCEDIDLARLAKAAGEITLMDFDSAAVKAALHRLESTGCDIKPEVKECDFVGIPRSDYIEFIGAAYTGIAELLRLIQNVKEAAGKDPEESCLEKNDSRKETIVKAEEQLEKKLLGLARSIYETNRGYIPGIEPGRYDYAVVMGVHSQLNNSFTGIWNYIAGAAEGTDSELYGFCLRMQTELEQLQREYTEGIVESFNRTVIEAVKKGLFVGYETESSANPGMCIEGAIQGARDIEKRLRERSLTMKECYMAEWPLDISRNLVYKMMIGSFDKSKPAG